MQAVEKGYLLCTVMAETMDPLRGEGLMGPKLGFWLGAIARWGVGTRRTRGARIENRKSGEKRQQGD
jgi:hypothetical protein